MLNFDNLTKRLVKELQVAAMHFDLYQSLKKAISTYKQGMNKSPNFWSLTLNAHLEAIRSSLCRLYDQTNRNNLSIRSWLIEFRCNHLKNEFFQPSEMDKFNRIPLKDGELDKDIEKVSLQDNLINTLFTKHRNNEVAHLSLKLVSRGESFWDTYPLTIDMIETLINRAEGIINKYSAHRSDVSYAILSYSQKDDYLFLLNSVQCAATQQL